MGKNWEVEFTIPVTIAVENAEDMEQAIEFAMNVGPMGVSDAVEITAREVPDSEWDSVKRHADDIATDD